MRCAKFAAVSIAVLGWCGGVSATEPTIGTIEDILAEDVRAFSAACGQVDFEVSEDSHLHPPNAAGVTPVDIYIFVLGIDNIDAVTNSFRFEGFGGLVWCDPREAFDPDETGGSPRVYAVKTPADLHQQLWWPEAFLPTRIGQAVQSGQFVTVFPDGTVRLALKFNTRLTARFDYNAFPLDRQTLVIPLQSYEYRSDVVELRSPAGMSGFDADFEIPEWTVLESGTRIVERPTDDGAAPFHRYQTEIVIARKSGFYFWKVLIPILIIMTVSWSVFWMTRDVLAQRQRQASTALLTIVAFQFVVAGFLPRVPYLTLMDAIILWSFCVIALTMGLNIRNIRAFRADPEVGLRRDRQWRWLYPVAYLAGLSVIFAWHFVLS